MIKCFYCDNPADEMKFIGVPGHIMVPNTYWVCNKHLNNWLQFEDIYNKDGSRKKYEPPRTCPISL